MCIEEGGAYAGAIGQESRQNKLENADLQNQIWSRLVTLGHHPTRTRADAKPSQTEANGTEAPRPLRTCARIIDPKTSKTYSKDKEWKTQKKNQHGRQAKT